MSHNKAGSSGHRKGFPTYLRGRQPHILHCTVEFPTWERARAFSYVVQIGLEEGFAANGATFETVISIKDMPALLQKNWLRQIQHAYGGRRFDQVWIEIVHADWDETFLQWVAEIAPVRVAYSIESLDYDPEVTARYPQFLNRRREVESRLRHMTHIVTADEKDADDFARRGFLPAFWWALAPVPERFFVPAPPVVTEPVAYFCGSLYGGRAEWLKRPDLAPYLQKLPSPEDGTPYPALFDTLMQNALGNAAAGRPIERTYMESLLDPLRTVRKEGHRLWMEAQRRGAAVVNLPSFYKGYASRVPDAMAAGRPVVSWEVPERPRTNALFADGEEILLYPQANPARLAEQVTRVVQEPSYGRKIAERALAKMKAHHTLEHRVGQILDWAENGTVPDYGENVAYTPAFVAQANEPTVMLPTVLPEPVPANQPLVSVIIPTYNRPEMLRDAIQSVLDQTYRNVEIIVVNDNGTDVQPLLDSLNDRGNICSVRHETNRRLSAARNTGLSLATGKYVAYLDDDDRFYPNHLETLVGFLENSDYKVAYSDAYRAVQELRDGQYVTVHRDVPHSNDFSADQLLIGNLTPVTCVVHERECLAGMDGFDETLTSHEDWEMWVRLSRKYPFAHLPTVTCEFTWREDRSTMTSSTRADYLRTMEIIHARFHKYAKDRPDILEAQRQSRRWQRSEIHRLAQEATFDPAALPELAVVTQETVVSIVIPTYNKLDFTRQCLEAIRAVTPAGLYEILVVDNASTDETPAFLREQERQGHLRAILNETNLGFGKACNRAAEQARGRCILLLNNDTVPHPGWLEAMLRTLDSDPNIGVVGSRLLYPDGTIQHAGVVFTAEGVPEHLHRKVPQNHPEVTFQRDFPAVTGACLLIRTGLYRQLGGFDEQYYMYVEDTDLCLRVWEAGYRVTYCPESVVTHFESASVRDFGWSNRQVFSGFRRLHRTWAGRWPQEVWRLSGLAMPAFTRGGSESLATIVWHAPLLDPSGYADEARHFLFALESAGESVAAIPISWSDRTAVLPLAQDTALRRMIARPAAVGNIHVSQIFPPHFTRNGRACLNIGRTMFETDRLPDGWAEACNQMDYVWVPTEFNRETFANAGVEAKRLVVIPGTLDVAAYDPQTLPLPIEGARGYNFLSVFDWTLRKGWDVLLRAYLEEFRADEDVSLILKTHSSLGFTTAQIVETVSESIRKWGFDLEKIPDIIFQDSLIPAPQMPALYAAADCFVMPSRGEGWGRPYMEAMAMALPVIGTNWSGNTAFMDAANSYLLDCTVCDVPEIGWCETPTYRGHRWAEPNRAHLRSLLRGVFTRREEAREIGKKARQAIAARFDYATVSALMLAEIARATGEVPSQEPTRIRAAA